MKLRFLGKETEKDESPTLYDTDRDSYLVQGWQVGDPGILDQLDLNGDETCVEVPRRLMAHLAKSQLLDGYDRRLPTYVCTDRDTYVIKGRTVTDLEALAQMNIPDHETCVEVTKALRAAMREDYAVVVD